MSRSSYANHGQSVRATEECRTWRGAGQDCPAHVRGRNPQKQGRSRRSEFLRIRLHPLSNFGGILAQIRLLLHRNSVTGRNHYPTLPQQINQNTCIHACALICWQDEVAFINHLPHKTTPAQTTPVQDDEGNQPRSSHQTQKVAAKWLSPI